MDSSRQALPHLINPVRHYCHLAIQGLQMKLKTKLFYSYVLFLIIYSGFVLLPAPSPATLLQYHVSATGLRVIFVTLIILLALIWYIGFYSYAKIRTYAQLIRGSKDGKQVAKLSKGIFLIVMWLPVSSTFSAILNYIAGKHIGFLPAATVIENYVSLLVPLMGFIYISRGARRLSEIVKQRPSYGVTNVLALLLIYIGLIYLRLVTTAQNRQSIYHMPVWVILTTLVAPYVYMWFMGLLAVYELYIYRRKVTGIIYRKSLGQLSFGLGWLIVLSIGLQYFSTLSAHLTRLSIYGILAIIYVLLLLLAIGFVFIANGTRKLQRIEEV
jgi:hypothetical protein